MIKAFGLIMLIGAWSQAYAHAPLDYETMKPRANSSNVKTTIADLDAVPCGPGVNSTPGPVQHQIVAGSQFRVKFIETIDHPAKYIIDLTSQSIQNDPLSAAEANQIVLFDPDGFYNDQVMPQDMANKFDRDQNPRSTTVAQPNPNAVYEVMVTIPADVTCQSCTLRLMQKMFDNNSLRNTVYTHCTDVSISAAEGNPPPPVKAPEQPTGLEVKLKK